ncbi:hypothetical protein, partial [Streptomyces sp. H51]|uniref:hypothetical protein n=1 Tax=Streptomyces sp. H51 TaxID=3111770 RepID=UPI003B63CBDF
MADPDGPADAEDAEDGGGTGDGDPAEPDEQPPRVPARVAAASAAIPARITRRAGHERIVDGNTGPPPVDAAPRGRLYGGGGEPPAARVVHRQERVGRLRVERLPHQH